MCFCKVKVKDMKKKQDLGNRKCSPEEMQGVILDVVKKRVTIEDYKVQAIRKRQIFFKRGL